MILQERQSFNYKTILPLFRQKVSENVIQGIILFSCEIQVENSAVTAEVSHLSTTIQEILGEMYEQLSKLEKERGKKYNFSSSN